MIRVAPSYQCVAHVSLGDEYDCLQSSRVIRNVLLLTDLFMIDTRLSISMSMIIMEMI
jgi:hypothetical protein